MGGWERQRTAPEDTERDERARPEPGDDFFCLRFQVWYPSLDCAIRTKFRTSPSCLRCDQGRFNLKRHAARLERYRFPFPPAELD